MSTSYRMFLAAAMLSIAAPALFALDLIQEVTLDQNSIVPLFEVKATESGYVSAQPTRVKYVFDCFGKATPGNFISGSSVELKRLKTGNVTTHHFQWTHLVGGGGSHEKRPPLIHRILQNTLAFSSSELDQVVQVCKNSGSP